MCRRRGRPKNALTKIHKAATAELQKKIQNSFNIEALDLCLKRGIITTTEHKSGIKLRWIYTLRFGVPTIQSGTPQLKFCYSKNYDEKLLQVLQRRYCSVIKCLKEIYADKLVMNVCIYNEFPDFLKLKKPSSYQEEKFMQGMKLLAKEFSKDLKCRSKIAKSSEILTSTFKV